MRILIVFVLAVLASEAAFGQGAKPVPPDAAPASVKPPYPPSPVIAKLTWAAKETIVRKAGGSDNWPIT